MKSLRYISFITLIQIIAGCSSTPGPQIISGNYYMTGGSNCESFRYSDDSSVKSIACYTSDGKYTGKIKAMSTSDLQTYAYNKLKEEMANVNEKQKDDASWNTDVYKERNSAYKVSRKTN